MSKLLKIAVAMAALIGVSGQAFAQGASTTRIETRPYYGATVTLEAGVRVFRPLPPTRRMIINPHGETPLSLGINETNVYEYRRSNNYHHHQYSGNAPSGYAGGAYPYYGGGFHGRRGGGHHGHGGGGIQR